VAQAIADSGGGGGDSGGGQTAAPFDFSTDPGYLAALNAEQTGIAQLDAADRKARIAAIVGFGDPGLAQAFGISDVDPLTAAMTLQNTQAGNSTLAQLQRSRDLTQANTVNQLAAHGLVRSGDLGWRTGQNQQDYATSLYNAQQGVLDTLAQSARDTALQKQQLHTNTVNALTGAYNTYIANPQFYGMAQGTTPPVTQTPAATPVTPVTTPPPVGYGGSGWTYNGQTYSPAPIPAPKPTAPVSRLATPNPYRFQTARNVRAG
jgi:hypothetical protein